jgi:hypothetical protein
MQTVNFPCGHCGQLMAVSTEHLGTQVHCPHCRQVVDAPAAESPPRPVSEAESILGSPDEVSDDLFGGPARPRIEFPADQPPDIDGPTRISATPPPSQAQEPVSGALPSAGSTSMPATVRPYRPPPRSNLGPILLIFLIPYAIVTTLFIAWLLYNQKKQALDYERMFDPNPKDGGPRSWLKHDMPLPTRLRTTLNKPLQIGELEILPREVKLNETGDLVLKVKLRNVSEKATFNPCPRSFVDVSARAMSDWSYTYLEGGSFPVYGGTQQWFKGSGELELDLQGGMLKPGESKQLELTTMARYQKTLKKMLQSPQPLLWRLHVRRGDFIEFGDKQFSTSAVIGIEFSPADVGKRL